MSLPLKFRIHTSIPQEKFFVAQSVMDNAVADEKERCAKIAEEARCHEECNHEACLRATRIAKQIRESK